jgi:HK97 family phage major capsid protein
MSCSIELSRNLQNLINQRSNNMNQKEITTKLGDLSSKLSDFSSNNGFAKIKELESKMSNMEAVFTRPGAIISQQTEDKAFTNYLRKGDMSGLETKAFSAGDEEGGVLIRPELYNKIISGIGLQSPMRMLAHIETISTSALDVIIEDGKFDSGWVADSSAREETNTPKLKSKRIEVHELYAQPKATARLLDDSALNIESWLCERLQNSFAQTENKSFFTGDGENQPFGILHYGHETVERVDAGQAGEIDPTDIINLINSLDEAYLASSTFIMHRSTLCEIQKLQDENGRFIWQPSICESQPQTLFGIPVVCSSDMPKFEAGKSVITLGDFRAAYKIVDRSGIVTMRDPYTEKPFVKFYSVKRVGGDLVKPEAIKFLKI